MLYTKFLAYPGTYLLVSFFLINEDITIQFNQTVVLPLLILGPDPVILTQVHPYVLLITLTVIKIKGKNSREEIFYFPSQFQRGQPVITWPHVYGQSIMVS